MDSISQMTQISQFNLENFDPEMSFQINLSDNNNNKNKNNFFIDSLSNDLKSFLKSDLSESVMNLTQCFICLSPAKNPLSCPKCNNFACKECLQSYFGDEIIKKCPLCNQDIKKSELIKNKTIREIEKILYKEDTKENKINNLSKLVNEKKKIWENKEKYLSNLINKVLKYQENLKEYRKKYELFFLNWKNQIDDIFEKFENKIKELIDLLLKYNQKFNNDFNNSINRYSKIKEKNKINEKDIKSLVNEILNMERNHFNEEIKNQPKELNQNGNFILFDEIIKKSRQFFITPIYIIPNISVYSISTEYIGKNELKKGKIKRKNYNVHIGNYQIEYIFVHDKYSLLSKFLFRNDKKASFFIIQKKVIESKSYEIIPMRYNSKSNYDIYETEVDFDEFKDDESIVVKMETKIQIFSLIT